MVDKTASATVKSKRTTYTWLVGTIIAVIFGAVILYAQIERAVQRVSAGYGHETFRTFWLIEFSYIGFLVTVVVAVFVLSVSLVIRWRHERQWREFERKYGVDNERV